MIAGQARRFDALNHEIQGELPERHKQLMACQRGEEHLFECVVFR